MADDLDTIDDTTLSPTESADEENPDSVSPAGESPSSADSEGEEVVDDSPEAVAEREKQARKADRLKAAEAAEKRDAALRAKKQRDRELGEREERLRAGEQQLQAGLRRMQAQLDEIEQRKVAIMRGGPEALKALGVEYGDWTKSYLEETAPDAVAQRALREAQEAKEELKREREAKAQREAQEAQQQSFNRLVDFADTHADEYPSAAELSPRVFRILADEAAHEFMREYSSPPSFEQLLPRLDRKAKAIHDEQNERTAKRARSGTKPSDGATTTPANPGHPASTPATRTLTPANAGTRATPRRDMTDDEKDEWARAELRAALAADRKAERNS